MNRLISAAALLAATAGFATAEPWAIDPTHTDVVVAWNHAGFSTQVANFYEFSGTLDLDLEDLSSLKADFTVPVASISTGYEVFDGHLQSADFFDAATYPEIRFVATSAEQTGEMTARVTGDMTIKGVTRPVTFDVTVNALGEHPVGQFFDAYKGTWMGLTATAEIKRSDWGIDAFIPVGSDEVTITINTEMKQGVTEFGM